MEIRNITAGVLAATALGVTLSACGSTIDGQAVSASTHAGTVTASSPQAQSDPGSAGRTYSLDNVTNLLDFTNWPTPECQATGGSVADQAVYKECIASAFGPTYTFHGHVGMAAPPVQDNVQLEIFRPDMTSSTVALCPVSVAGCTSVKQDDSVYVVMKYVDMSKAVGAAAATFVVQSISIQ